MPFDDTASASRVYVPVPADRVDDVFRFLLGLSKPEEEDEAELDRLIQRIYRESEQRFRDLLLLLAHHPGTPMSTDEIADELKLYRGPASLAGMLGAYGRRSNHRYDGFFPFERLHNPADERYELVMPQKIAGIIEQISSSEP